MALQRNDNFTIAAPKSIDTRYGVHASTIAANAAVVQAFRYQGLTVGIDVSGSVVEYWYRDGISDGDLIEKTSSGILNASDGSGNELKIGNSSNSGHVILTARSSDTNSDVVITPKGTGTIQATSSHSTNISDDQDLVTKIYADTNYGFDKTHLTYDDIDETITGEWTFSGEATFSGGIVITGSVVEVDSQITTSDAVIDMNDGEVGSGVTLGYSGLLVDRGTVNPYWIGFDESRDFLTAGFVADLSEVQTVSDRVATMVDSPNDEDVAVWDSGNQRWRGEAKSVITGVTYGDDGEIAYSESGSFAYSSVLKFVSGVLQTPQIDSGNVRISGNTITTSSGDLNINATGNVNLLSAVGFGTQVISNHDSSVVIDGTSKSILSESISTGGVSIDNTGIISSTGAMTLNPGAGFTLTSSGDALINPSGNITLGSINYPKSIGTVGQVLGVNASNELVFLNAEVDTFELQDGNGTTANGSAVDLGGAAANDTIVSNSNGDLVFGFETDFQAANDSFRGTGIYGESGTVERFIGINDDGIAIDHTDTATSRQSRVNVGWGSISMSLEGATANTDARLNLTADSITLSRDDSGGSGDTQELLLNDSAMRVRDDVNNIGLQYFADYSSNFSDRSIIDKAYVDSYFSVDDLSTNTVLDIATFERTSSGTPANGIGGAVRLGVESNGAGVRYAAIEYSLPNALDDKFSDARGRLDLVMDGVSYMEIDEENLVNGSSNGIRIGRGTDLSSGNGNQVVIGAYSQAGTDSVSIGSEVLGSGATVADNQVSIGRRNNFNVAVGANSTSVGAQSSTTGSFSGAFGRNMIASGTGSYMIGYGNASTHNNSLADSVEFNFDGVSPLKAGVTLGVRMYNAVNDAAVSAPEDGSIYYDTTNNLFRSRLSGAWGSIITTHSAQTGYTTFSNLSTDRTLDADSTTIDEVADVLGTLIEDLKTKGIISA